MEATFVSLLPPLVAIALAVISKRVILPLAIGVAVGAALVGAGDPENVWWWSIPIRFVVVIWDSISHPDHLLVLAFTLLLGAMVGVLESTGSLGRVIASLAQRVTSRRGGQTMIGLAGLAIFFDDYANTLLVGGTMRPAADRYGISRAKLAYLVDSTAAPVAGLTLVSTWVATEISYLREGLAAAGMDDPSLALSIFIQSLPYRFYPWLAIVMVFAVALLGRDFGPMLAEEQRAASGSEDPSPTGSVLEPETVSAARDRNLGFDWFAAISPVAACLVTLLTVLIVTGRSAIAGQSGAGELPPGGLAWWGEVIGQGQSYWALTAGGGAGWLVALLAGWFATRGDVETLVLGSLNGLTQMLPAMAVLWLAWALSTLTGADQLDTSGYLTSILDKTIRPAWLPTCVFIIAGTMAFATGTSWGTMAILTPIAVGLVLDLQPDPLSPITLATFSSVLAGAIFGDHCSPISDTTVLSSRACQCDHLLHVRTQMPYSLVAAAVSIALGTTAVGAGVPVTVALPTGMLVIIGCVAWLGTPVEGTRVVPIDQAR